MEMVTATLLCGCPSHLVSSHSFMLLLEEAIILMFFWGKKVLTMFMGKSEESQQRPSKPLYFSDNSHCFLLLAQLSRS